MHCVICGSGKSLLDDCKSPNPSLEIEADIYSLSLFSIMVIKKTITFLAKFLSVRSRSPEFVHLHSVKKNRR